MLFALGSNGHGQLGVGHDEDVHQPSAAAFEPADDDSAASVGDRPVRIAAGGNHTLLLYASRRVFVCGRGSAGQTALGRDTSRLASVPGAWADVAAGWDFAVWIDAQTRSVWSTGVGRKGELGLGRTHTQALVLTKVELPGRARCVQAGLAHVVCQLENDELWGWGDNRAGQIHDRALDYVHHFRPVRIDQRARSFACGKAFTIYVRTDGEALVTCREDKHGIQCGVEQADIPCGLASVYAGWNTAHILDQNGHLLSFGRSDRGQCPPTSSLRFKSIAAGSEHGIGLTMDGKVVAWGFNEHGNCGRQDLRDIVDSISEIPEAQNARFVAAGCATTWFWKED